MAAAPAKKHWLPGSLLPECIVGLVAKLRFYLGGANYSSGRYAATHDALFRLEQELHALDLDGGRVLRDEDSLPVAVLLYELCTATERVEELLRDMKSAVDEAGAGGGNGGSVAAAQAAVAGCLDADGGGNLTRMKSLVGSLTSLCQRGKPILDAARYSEAESEQLNKEPAVDGASTEPIVAGGGFAKFMRKTKGKLHRLLR
ncbi:hypothetical protein ACP70R_005722 [Stipagrostis hirtigluma subsp. patula]